MRRYFYKIGFNTCAQIISKILIAFLGFLSISALTRYLGPTDFGNFTLTFAFLSFFGIFADFGLQLTMSRDLAKNANLPTKIYGTFFWIKIFLIIFSLSLALIALLFFPYSSYIKKGIAIASLGIGIGFLNSFGTTIFQANFRMDLVALADTLAKAITTGFIFIFIFLKKDFYYILNTILIGNFVSLVIIIYFLNKMKKINFEFDWRLAKKVLKKSTPVAIISALALMYFKVDTLILSIVRGPQEVAIYGLAYKIIENLLVFWGFYMATTYPLLAKLLHANKKSKLAIILWKKSLFFSIISSSVIALSVFIFSPLLILVVGGKNFHFSVTPLRILIFALPLFFINNLLYHSFLLEEEVNLILKTIAYSLVFNLILNLIFIPKYGYLAASVSTVGTEAFMLINYLINIKKIKLLRE